MLVGIGKVGEQPGGVDLQVRDVVDAARVRQPDNQLAGEPDNARQDGVGALLVRLRCADGERAVGRGAHEAAVQPGGARGAHLGGEVAPRGRRARRSRRGRRGGEADEGVQLGWGDARVVADEPRLVGHDPQPEVAVLEPGLDPYRHQDGRRGGHGEPPGTSVSPRMSTRSGSASVAAAHSCPAPAAVLVLFANR